MLCVSSQDEYEKYLQIPTQKCKVVQEMEKALIASFRKEKSPKYWLWDQVAMAAAINDSVVKETREVYCRVELQGGATRGQTVIDWKMHFKKPPNVRLILNFDKDLLNKIVYQAVET